MERKQKVKWITFGVLSVMSLLLVLPWEPLVGLPARESKIPLGLDLQGGCEFVLAIDMEQLETDVRHQNMGEQEETIQRLIASAREDAQPRTLQIVRNRVDQLGTREPVIFGIRGQPRIVVQLPGADRATMENAERELKRIAFLAFHLVHRQSDELVNPLMARRIPLPGYRIERFGEREFYVPAARGDATEDALNRRDPFSGRYDQTPPGYKFILERHYMANQNLFVYRPILVRRLMDLDGRVITGARVEMDEWGNREVALNFSEAGRRRFQSLTAAYCPQGTENPHPEGRRLAVVLDDIVFSSPSISEEITTGGAVIRGRFPGDEAYELARVLRTGSLPTRVTVLEKHIVDPTLGEDSIRSGVLSILVGGGAVILFMLVYYRLGGMVANLALVFNLILLPLGMVLTAGFLGTLLGAGGGGNPFALPVLTLPGIAGILLTIGMAVDANVLIFERMREEFKGGKNLMAGIEAGYDRAFMTIMDANITTLLTGVILFIFGSGPIRGFAVTLCAGIVVSVYTALVFTKMVFRVIGPKLKTQTLRMLSFFGETHIDFVGLRKPAALLSIAVIVVSFSIMAVKYQRDPATVMGVDFLSGTEVVFGYTGERPSVEAIRTVLSDPELGLKDTQIQYRSSWDPTEAADALSIKTTSARAAEQSAEPISIKDRIEEALNKSFPDAAFAFASQNEVDPVVAGELKFSALTAIALALVLMVIYVSVRFKFGFALGAIVALVHDVLVSVGLYTLFGRQISLPIVAAMLTIVGYSVNDTIVVFDRIREDLRATTSKSLTLHEICNLSMNQTLNRTILTSVTTLLAVVMLLIFGGGAINDFALALCIGIIAGTYSTVFIATPIVLWHYGKQRPDFSAPHLR